METPQYHLSDVEINRAVSAMRADVRSHELVDDYLDSTWSHYRDTASAQRILLPIRAKAQDAFRHNLDIAVANSAPENKATHAFREIPTLFISKAFKNGVALGTAANYALLGKHTDELLIPYIEAMMPFTDVDPDTYLDSIETIALEPYSRTAQ